MTHSCREVQMMSDFALVYFCSDGINPTAQRCRSEREKNIVNIFLVQFILTILKNITPLEM